MASPTTLVKTDNSPRLVIVTLTDIVDTVWHGYQAMVGEGKLSAGLERSLFSTYVYRFFEDDLNERLQWSGSRGGKDHLAELFPALARGLSGEDADGASEIYQALFDPLEVRVHALVERLLPESTWLIVTTQYRVEDEEVFIEIGEDFRVVDWMRRRKAGLLSPTDWGKHIDGEIDAAFHVEG